jgi:demethylmenaquinone methyltransferase / 2-methoxy-6-polyprenyl-1,4-benzoquinol methylase
MLTSETTTPAWNKDLLKHPHAVSDKRGRVQRMFAAIAPSYDLNNRLHSLWMDQRWRAKAVRLANCTQTDQVIDVACGTGDLTIKFAEKVYSLALAGRPGQVTGIDFTFAMLPIAVRKWSGHGIVGHQREGSNGKPGADYFVTFINGDAQALPLPDASADIVSIAFGIRNVADPAAAICEFHRVMRPGGRLVILEFSLPANPILRSLYNFYFRKILPRTATLISGDKSGAYKYLPESVNTFIGRQQMMEMMRNAGFEAVEQFPMTFGVCVCYRGGKRQAVDAACS